MLQYLIHRVITSAIVLVGLSLLAFFLVRLAPGDTVTAMLGARYNQADAATLRDEYGFDKPVIVQYGVWVGRVVRGNFGESTTGEPVVTMIGRALPVTGQLAAMALAMALIVGIPLGVIAAVRSGGATDAGVSAVGLVGVSVPGFWLGTMLILLFSLGLGWLPPGGYVSTAVSPWRNITHMLMPAAALGATVTAIIMQMTRGAMLAVKQEDYIRTARAKGLKSRVVWFHHALRNALGPVLTIAGIQAGYLLGGSVVIEQVFSLPGLGRMALHAIERRDYPLLQGVILLIGAAFIVINLIVDLLHGRLDPRIETTGEATR